MRYIHAYINNIYLYIIYVCMCVGVHILEGGDQLQTKTFTSDHMQTVLSPPSPPTPILMQAGVDYKSRPLVPIQWLARHHVGGM